MKIDFEKLDNLLLDKCWSVAELARRAGLTSATVSRLRNGKNRNPMRLTVAKIAKALDVSPKELLVQE